MSRAIASPASVTRVAGLLAALLLGGCNATASVAPVKPSPASTATVQPSSASSAIATAPTPTDTPPPATPVAPTEDPVTSARSGVTVADLVGTWTGDLSFVPMPGAREKPSTWATTVTIEQCARGVTCGAFTEKAEDLDGTGKAQTCDGTLKYRGFYKDRAAFEFEQSITSSAGPHRCAPMIMVLTPLSSGSILGVEERSHGLNSYGALLKSEAP